VIPEKGKSGARTLLSRFTPIKAPPVVEERYETDQIPQPNKILPNRKRIELGTSIND
jgi:hypothetical protein